MKTDTIRKFKEALQSIDGRNTIIGDVTARDVLAELTALETRIIELEEEEELHGELVMLQRSRMQGAEKAWQKAHNKPNTWPDLGELIQWMEQRIMAKDEALKPFAAVNDWDAEFVKGSHHDDPSKIVFSPGPIPAPGESQDRPLILRGDLRRAKAALTPPTGKVLVDREKLREIEWAGVYSFAVNDVGGQAAYECCPICRGIKPVLEAEKDRQHREVERDQFYSEGHAADCWFAYALKKSKPCMIEIPCQSCGNIVKVWAIDGIYQGCVFCPDCMAGHDVWQYREQF